MESSGSETETPLLLPNKKPALRKKNKKTSNSPKSLDQSWPVRKSKVTLEGYINDVGSDQDSESGSSCGGVGRTKTLTDEDLEELKGCLDLGFGFSYDEIPELCSTLPALELCYSMSQMYFDDHHRSSDANSSDHDSVASLLRPLHRLLPTGRSPVLGIILMKLRRGSGIGRRPWHAL